MPSAHGGQKRVFDSLKLKVQMAVSQSVDAGSPGFLQELQMPLDTEPSHRPLVFPFFN